MSQLAGEILGVEETVTDVEFLGAGFDERRAALQKVDAYRAVVKQALHDTIEGLVGQEVHMTFRPSSVLLQDGHVWVSCYSLTDEVRKPIEDTVVIGRFFSETDSLVVTRNTTSPPTVWTVNLGGVISIAEAEVTKPDA